jgi:hypothetical protein
MVGQRSDVVVFGVGACPFALEILSQYNRLIWEGICEVGERLARLGVVLLGLS